jgi:hypothetical protein
MNRYKNKKAMELAVNTIVMLIIGLIIFGLGMGLFMKFYSSSDQQVNELNNKIKTNIASLECDENQWVCSPTQNIKSGEIKTYLIYISNLGENKDSFTIKLNGESSNSITIDGKCGPLKISYPNIEIPVKSGYSGEIPIIINSKNLKNEKCTYIVRVELYDSTGLVGKTPMIVKVN